MATPTATAQPLPAASAPVLGRAYQDQPVWCTRHHCEEPRWQRDEENRRAAIAYSDAYWQRVFIYG